MHRLYLPSGKQSLGKSGASGRAGVPLAAQNCLRFQAVVLIPVNNPPSRLDETFGDQSGLVSHQCIQIIMLHGRIPQANSSIK